MTSTEETKDVELEDDGDLPLVKEAPKGHSLWFKIDFNIFEVWFNEINEKCKDKKLHEMNQSVKDLRRYVNTHGVLRQYFVRMIEQAVNIYGEVFKTGILPQTTGKFWKTVNEIVNSAPKFHGLHLGGDPNLIGVPLAAMFTLYDGTPAGTKFFGDTGLNKQLQKLLTDWGKYLNSKKSQYVLNDSRHGWLSKKAKKDWSFDDYVLPSDKPPYWNSFNDWFHREIKIDKRPLGKGITSCNDGYVWVYPYRGNLKKNSKFWLKDSMPYSLQQIFAEDLSKYVEVFVNGGIFQTFLGPFNYHRWHAPVSGKIEKIHIYKGTYYKKLIVPDLSGSTTSSLPYILHINTKGFLIIDTSDTVKIGRVCCIPIGMCEVSSVLFSVKEGDKIKKGDEMGYFAFGGSSFAIIFEDFSRYNKKLKIIPPFDHKATLPTPNGGQGTKINVRQQFAKIIDS